MGDAQPATTGNAPVVRAQEPSGAGATRFVLSISSSSDGSIGMAGMDLNAPYEVILAEFASDSHWFFLEHWVHSFCHSEEGVSAVLVPTGAHHRRMQEDIVAFFKMDEQEDLRGDAVACPKPELFRLSQGMFNAAAGRERLVQLACTHGDTMGGRRAGGMATATASKASVKDGAFNALCVFMEEKMGGWDCPPESIIVRDASATSVKMDVIAEDALEALNVFYGLENGKKRSRGVHDFMSLFDLLSSHCVTKQAKLMLRSNLVQPLSDVEMIRGRHDAVVELMEDQNQIMEIQTALRDVSRTMHGIEVLCRNVRGDSWGSGSCVSRSTVDSKILALTSSLIQLHEFCEGLNALDVAVMPFKCEEIAGIQSLFSKSTASRAAASEALQSLFEDHVVDSFRRSESKRSPFMSKSQQIFALKGAQSRWHRLLDIHRARFTAGTEKVSELAGRLRASYPAECGSLSVKYSNSRGFYFCVNTTASQLPEESGLKCLTVGGDGGSGSGGGNGSGARGGRQGMSRTGSQTIQVTCEELNALNMRINTASRECLRVTRDILIEHLSDLLQSHIGPLVAMQDAIAKLDMLSGLACFALVQESEGRTYVRPLITRHGPSLVIQDGRHPMLDRQTQGKCVPNDSMLADDCATCIVTGPNMAGKSCFLKLNGLLVIMAQIGSLVPATFMSVTPFGGISVIKQTSSAKQMHQVVRTLRAIRSDRPGGHLVLVDELCDVASSYATLALSWALTEEFLVSNTKALVATHVTSLSKLCDLYPNCRGLRVDDQRKIREGTVRDGGYGIDLARTLGFPETTVDTAARISAQIAERVSRNVQVEYVPSLARERAVLKACSRIDCLKELRGIADEKSLMTALLRIRDELESS